MDPELSLLDFLGEAELQHYYDAFRNELKVHRPSQLKYVTDDDLRGLCMSRPERRRLHKYYCKHHSQNYLAKIRRLLGPATKRGDGDDKAAAATNRQHHHHDAANRHIIAQENIVVNKELGAGEFGVVQQGVWTDEGRCVQVAVKCLYKDRVHTDAIDFLKEAAIMHDIDHENVVRLYGVVLHPHSLMLVTELAPLRSLLECLKEPSLRPSFPVPTLCDFALQICNGMAYLESKRLIHRDLAARNILVFAKNKVKISDFGLSRALGAGKDYYQTNFNVNLKLPIAWCAPECISYLRFTSSSDVWAFGVTTWEMFSYGFQPWAAFSGHQILEAIDAPNFQRLEQPEYCPREYYSLMLKCWAHEPSKRPKFSEISSLLPECKPEQVQAAISNGGNSSPKKPESLEYKIGDIITVLDKNSCSNRWKGVLDNGTTGYFNPLNTVSYLGSSLPSTSSSANYLTNLRSSLVRNDKDRSTITRRKLRSTMISGPQGDVKHMGHVGLDGAYFGDVSFLEYNNLPKQIVTPYKPSEDLEQQPLINPNSPSHLTGDNSSPMPHSLLRCSDWNDKSSNMISIDGNSTDKEIAREYGNVEASQSHSAFNFDTLSIHKHVSKFIWPKKKDSSKKEKDEVDDVKNCFKANDSSETNESEVQVHDYQEISDEDDHKTSEFEQSLLNEMELMFQSFSESRSDHNNETGSKTNSIASSKKKNTVKPISAHDQRTLDSAIALANKITVKSMTDLENEEPPHTPASPAERSKFSFLFPLVGGSSSNNSSNNITKTSDASHNHKLERRNFSQEAQSVPDIQASLTEESKIAYESLVEQPCRLEMTLLKMKQKQVAAPLQLNGKIDHDTTDSVNPIPVPPRDHTKHVDAGKRHVRKYPLVILSSNGNHDDINENSNSNKNVFYSLNPFDTPSLNFEAQIENDFSSIDCVDGGMNNLFHTDKVPIFVNSEDPIINFIDESPTATSSTFETFQPTQNALMKHSPDRVSVEDLLEFADHKPCGRQRGADSDEVRIMCKVLNQQVTPEACLLALEFASWNVHRAIKLAKLKFMGLDSPTLYDCSRALESCEWDVARAAAMLADSADIAQV